MQRQFVVPQGLDEPEFIADLSDALSGYTDHQLAEAARHFRDTRTVRTMPTIAECRQACERFAAAPVAPSARQARRAWPTDEERRSEAIARRQREDEATRLVRMSDVADTAHQEDWLCRLLEFVEDTGRLPHWREARDLRAQAQQVDDNLRREPRPAIYRSLCELRQSMKERAVKRVYGERAAPAG